jgi:AcrR family transcriptional regulator
MVYVSTSGIARRREIAQKDRTNTAYQERRAEIIVAGAKVFKVKGYTGTSLADIAEELGTDRANLYYYVGSKEELFREVVTGAIEHNLHVAEAVRSGSGTAATKLREIITSLMLSYEENYPVLYVYIQENRMHLGASSTEWEHEMAVINHRYEKLLITLIEDGYADGSIRDVGPAWIVAFAILGMLGWTNRWFDPHRSRASAAEVGETFADLVLRGVSTKRR